MPTTTDHDHPGETVAYAVHLADPERAAQIEDSDFRLLCDEIASAPRSYAETLTTVALAEAREEVAALRGS